MSELPQAREKVRVFPKSGPGQTSARPKAERHEGQTSAWPDPGHDLRAKMEKLGPARASSTQVPRKFQTGFQACASSRRRARPGPGALLSPLLSPLLSRGGGGGGEPPGEARALARADPRFLFGHRTTRGGFRRDSSDSNRKPFLLFRTAGPQRKKERKKERKGRTIRRAAESRPPRESRPPYPHTSCEKETNAP